MSRRPRVPCHLRASAAGAAVWALVMAAIPSLAAAAAPAEPSASADMDGAALEYLSPDDVFRILGKDVVSATGEKMGRIIDVLFDHSGKPSAAVIDFGGFLGVGTRKIAVAWNALHFDLGDKKNIVLLDLGREQLHAAPEYKESDKPIPVVTVPQPAQSHTAGSSW